MISKINISKFSRFFLIPLLLFHLLLLSNTTFTLWPEMVVYPYLLNNQFVLYKDIINPYPPLLTFALSIFASGFGYHPQAYKVLTLIIILLIDFLLFVTTYKIFKSYVFAFLSTAFFVTLSTAFGINGLWYDLVLTPFILLAFYNFFNFLKSRKNLNLYTSFFFLIIAFLIKQQIILLICYFLLLSIIKLSNPKKLFKIFYPLVIFFGVILILQSIIFFKLNVLGDFIYWTIIFPFFKASTSAGYVLLPTFKQVSILVALFAIAIPSLFTKDFYRKLIFISAFILLALAYPRFDYFHMVPALAIISIIIGPTLMDLSKTNFAIRSIMIIALIYLYLFSVRYVYSNWQKQIRFFELEIFSAAQLVKTLPDSPVYIQNGPDQILPLAGKLPIKPWADEFPWYLENNVLQSKITQGIQEQNPLFVIYQPYSKGAGYKLGAYRPKEIAAYLDDNYRTTTKITDNLWLRIKK